MASSSERETPAPIARDAARYARLRILGCAPAGTRQLEQGSVLRAQSLDAVVDADMKTHPSRGEAVPAGEPPVLDAQPLELVRQRCADFREGYRAGFERGEVGEPDDIEDAWDRSRASAELAGLRLISSSPAPVLEAQRCDGRYPVGHPRDEPFPVTYRCGRQQGHEGPHGADDNSPQPIEQRPNNRAEPIPASSRGQEPHHMKHGDSTLCGAARVRGNSYYEWAYVDCPDCLAKRLGEGAGLVSPEGQTLKYPTCGEHGPMALQMARWECATCGAVDEVAAWDERTNPFPLRPSKGRTAPLSQQRDDDIPIETRRELMHCATQNGRISYYYLCDIFRRGRNAGCSFSASPVPLQRAIDCPLCGESVPQVSSDTLSLALWQHVNWVCEKRVPLQRETGLRALVEQWRESAAGKAVSGDDYYDGQRSAYWRCAKTLEALLTVPDEETKA